MYFFRQDAFMFLRCSKRNKDGKLHRYWSVVENRRVGRKVHHRQALYLGEINDSEREAWCRAISVFDEDASEEQQLKLYPSDWDIPAHAEQQGVMDLLMKGINAGMDIRAISVQTVCRSSSL
jgi:hypothetical protein